MVKQESLLELEKNLGFKQLSPTWAKVEIFLGLGAAGAGLLLSNWSLSQPMGEILWVLVGSGLCLFVLGGYLALAGHRSHLYQSSNKLTAYLVEEIRRMQDKG